MRIKKGKYIICDPCYFYPDSKWSDFCDSFFRNGDGEQQDYDGERFFCANTAYGDGEYDLTDRKAPIAQIAVDAGMIGVIPLDLAIKWCEERGRSLSWVKRTGIIELLQDTDIFCRNGNISFDNYEIITDGSDFDEEESDEYD